MPAGMETVAIVRRAMVVYGRRPACPAGIEADGEEIAAIDDLAGHQVGIIKRAQARATRYGR